jgi:Transcriptional regulatory protein, C terminal
LPEIDFNLVKNIKKNLFLLALPLCVAGLLLPVPNDGNGANNRSDSINLALRRTAHSMLRAMGDSTSQIPPVEQLNDLVWRVRMDSSFNYDALPALLQSSLAQYKITWPYNVQVRQCGQLALLLGYHQLDITQPQADSSVPCGGRDMPAGCYEIEVHFLKENDFFSFKTIKNSLLLLLFGVAGGYWLFRWRRKSAMARQQKIHNETPSVATAPWLNFGNSRLDAAAQVLECAGTRHELTYREAKLLRLLASHPGELLERDTILQQVWADEGIMVGRSVDVFVSRLRKKLSADARVAIVAVHGVGYRLTVG